MSVEYVYANRELTESIPDLNHIHMDAGVDAQLAGHCGPSRTFCVHFIEDEDESGVPLGKGTVSSVWSEALCDDCKTAFDNIVDDRAPEVV